MRLVKRSICRASLCHHACYQWHYLIDKLDDRNLDLSVILPVMPRHRQLRDPFHFRRGPRLQFRQRTAKFFGGSMPRVIAQTSSPNSIQPWVATHRVSVG